LFELQVTANTGDTILAKKDVYAADLGKCYPNPSNGTTICSDNEDGSTFGADGVWTLGIGKHLSVETGWVDAYNNIELRLCNLSYQQQIIKLTNTKLSLKVPVP
jgi:hypothetical protein